MRRFLVTAKLELGVQVRLSLEETKHALRALRLTVGDQVLLADGHGREAEGTLLSAEKEGALLEVTQIREVSSGRSERVELVQAPLKGPRMDWLVEKATELGVDRIHLLESQYAVGSGEKIDRWQRLAQAAVKQSGNLRLPEILPVAIQSEVLSRVATPGAALFLLSPTAHEGLAQAITKAVQAGSRRIVLAIGPEGGFSAAEEEAFLRAGFQACLLSPQILRGETAACAALAIALHALDFSSPGAIATRETSGI